MEEGLLFENLKAKKKRLQQISYQPPGQGDPGKSNSPYPYSLTESQSSYNPLPQYMYERISVPSISSTASEFPFRAIKDGRNIKSSAQKVAPQKTSIDIPEIVTYDNNSPSLNPTGTIEKNSYKMSSSHENIVESNGQGDTSKLISEANNHLKAPGHTSMNSDHARKDSIKPNKHFPPRTSTSSSLKTALVMVHENDFQPTAPGISPGAGHTKTNKNDKEESGHCLNNKCIDSFRPTAPGDSPGAGHSLVNDDNKVSEQGKRQGAAQTQLAQTNDYQPTPPGHSPAAGHPDLHNKRKPNS